MTHVVNPMQKPKIPAPGTDVRRLFVTQPDIAAAERLLTLLSTAETTATDVEGKGGPKSREELVKQARADFELRKRRIALFEGRISAEASYLLLLGLYVTEGRGAALTVTELIHLVWLSHSTALRWIDLLVDEGWIIRDTDRTDARRAQLSLAPKARKTMDKLFG